MRVYTTRKMEIANLTCRNTNGTKELLDIFSDYFYPTIKNQIGTGSRKNKETLFYRFIDLGITKIDNELVLYGRFVKNLNIQREQILEGDKLVESHNSMSSAPSSFFILILSNHKLLWIREVSRAPSLKDLNATLIKMLEKQRTELIAEYMDKKINGSILKVNEKQIELEAFTKYPQLELKITPLSNNVSISEKISKFDKIHKIILKVLKRNSELGSEFNNLANTMSNTRDGLEATDIKAEIKGNSRNPLNKEKTIEFLQGVSDGNHEYRVTGIDENSNPIEESNETVSLYSSLRHCKETAIENIATYINAYRNTVRLYSTLPRNNQDAYKKLRKIEAELQNERE